jgi:hypothetical protein
MHKNEKKKNKKKQKKKRTKERKKEKNFINRIEIKGKNTFERMIIASLRLDNTLRECSMLLEP